MKKNKRQAQLQIAEKATSAFQDTFIREVRVSYQTTSEALFQFSNPTDAAQFVRKILIDNSREQFIALYLDGAHRVASFSIISIGTANQATVHPREVFQRAIGVGAVALVIAHNHPSGQSAPSNADREVTNLMKAAGKLLGIPLLDHVIVTENGHYSFLESCSL